MVRISICRPANDFLLFGNVAIGIFTESAAWTHPFPMLDRSGSLSIRFGFLASWLMALGAPNKVVLRLQVLVSSYRLRYID